MILYDTKFTLLGYGKLENIFAWENLKAAISDFAILRGAVVSSPDCNGVRNGYYWTKTKDGKNAAYYFDFLGFTNIASADQRLIGCRPALEFSKSSDIFLNEKYNSESNNGIIEIEYGYYPQSIVNEGMQKTLELNYTNNSLKMTDNHYTVDSSKYDDYSKPFSCEEIMEYEFNNKRYVRVQANFSVNKINNIEQGDYVWVEVEPITWLVNLDSNVMMSKKILFAGIQFNNQVYDEDNSKKDDIVIFIFANEHPNEEDFDNTDIKKYLDNYFSKEITQSMDLKNEYETDEDKIIRVKK